jgi:hypothetical protein
MTRTATPDPILVPADMFHALVAGATGGSFDLGARDETWDGAAAEKSYNLPGDADCYMWKNPDGDPATKSSYKLPFVSKTGGKHAVWGGITAIAGRLSSTQIPAADKKAVQSKLSGYYAKARTKYDDDQIETPFTADTDELLEARGFLERHGATGFLDDDEITSILLLARYVGRQDHDRWNARFADAWQHDYRGAGGACVICGGPPDGDMHFAALSVQFDGIDLTAAGGGGTAWTATLCVAGVPTVDSGVKRLLDPDGGSWLPLPLPLAIMDDSPHADVVTRAPVCGRIDQIWWAGNICQAAGVFSDGSDDADVAAAGAKAVALVSERLITGISVDLVDVETAVMVYQSGGTEPPDLDDANDPIGDGDGYQVPGEIPDGTITDVSDMPDIGWDDDDLETVICFTQWTIAGATICPVQALTQATITVTADADKRASWRHRPDWKLPALTASAAGLAPLKPPQDWFADPELREPTALSVTKEGRVYGHIAAWGTCHTGRPGTCVTAPRSPSGYRNFHRGELETREGTIIPVGTLTMNTGHASLRLNAASTVAHYDDTGTQAVHGRAGEDAHGIWFAGAVDPDLSAEDLRRLRAAQPSGDWRELNRGEGLDLFAVLAVNVPGFPIQRTGARLVAAGDELERVALVAAGPVTAGPVAADVRRRVTVAAAAFDGVAGLAALIN